MGDSDSPPWTTQHHLVGKPVARSALCPLAPPSDANGSDERNDPFAEYYQYVENDYTIAYHQIEDPRKRKPALWRALIPQTSSSSESRIFRAAETVPSHWKSQKTLQLGDQSNEIISVPSSQAVSIVQGRIDTFSYQSVVRDWLRHMVLLAAIEECQNQFLQQCLATQRQNGTLSSPSEESGIDFYQSTCAPPYYRQPPSAYLANYTNGSNAATVDQGHSTLPVQFTPSQLVQRIKHGCSLAWQDYERKMPLLIQMKSNSAATAALLERRASSRLARQQMDSQEGNGEVETKSEWKVIPGGKIAMYLRNNLISKKKEKYNAASCVNDDGNNPGGLITQADAEGCLQKRSDDDSVDEINENGDGAIHREDQLNDDNPYLIDAWFTILEWLGKKTSKFLASSDIQPLFPSLLPPAIKKKKKTTDLPRDEMANIGANLTEYLSPTDIRIWSKMLSDGAALEGDGARFYFKVINDDDTANIVDLEPSSFGRLQFTIRIWNETAALKMSERALQRHAEAEVVYREKKAWGMWRHKGINMGYTIWPSWMKAVDTWRRENGSDSKQETLEARSSKIDDVSDADDLAIAKSLAEQDAIQSSGGTRRSRRSAGDGSFGVFYGSQSNLTHKQLVEALLRLISLSSYQTSSGLTSAVVDGGADPHRRIRAALGKLLWKRNQVSRLTVQAGWSDATVWQTLGETPLTTVDEDIEQTLSVKSTSEEIQAFVCYVKGLQETELRLRQIVMEHITEIPVEIIATSADEKPGGSESLDGADFEADNGGVEWRTSGHDLLNKVIFRPLSTEASDDIGVCLWFSVVDFCDPVAATPDDGDVPVERPQIGIAKESNIVARRRRFRVCPTANPTTNGDTFRNSAVPVLTLTEAQVHAGLKAAELEIEHAVATSGVNENPYAGSEATPITLIPTDGSSHEVGVVVGHDCVFDSNGIPQQRILFLSKNEGESRWGRLSFRELGITECIFEGSAMVYILQRFEFQPSSPAFQECRNIVEFLSRHPKVGPFMEPVDAVALNVPHYFDVIKNPMDLSTLSNNLEKGKYSDIPVSKTSGQSPTARMLNGPFCSDLDLIFDNAMTFNPPDDWIHQAAATLKKLVSKKIDQITNMAEEVRGRSRPRNSVYVDDDSDCDVYEYESDQEEEYVASGRNRKRKRPSVRAPVKEDCSTRSIERSIRLQKIFSDSMGLRGSLANMPVNTDASTYSFPTGWGCRHVESDLHQIVEVPDPDTELDELIALQKSTEDRENSNSRRSTRTQHDVPGAANGANAVSKAQIEYFCFEKHLPLVDERGHAIPLPRNRVQLEQVLENVHERYFAKLSLRFQRAIKLSCDESFGAFTDGSFPPYLGRVLPHVSSDLPGSKSLRGLASKWEIRDVYLIPALRWVIRGLIRSEHLFELEQFDSLTESGVVLPNHVYYVDSTLEPFDVVHVRELTKRKKRTNDGAGDSSDDDVKLSDYEKLRAERVARNTERLQSLGLA